MGRPTYLTGRTPMLVREPTPHVEYVRGRPMERTQSLPALPRPSPSPLRAGSRDYLLHEASDSDSIESMPPYGVAGSEPAPRNLPHLERPHLGWRWHVAKYVAVAVGQRIGRALCPCLHGHFED